MGAFLKEDTAGLGGRWNVARSEEEVWNLGDQNTEKRKCLFCGRDDAFGPGCVAWHHLSEAGGYQQLEMWSAAGRCSSSPLCLSKPGVKGPEA